MVDKSNWLKGTPMEMFIWDLHACARLQKRNFDRGIVEQGLELTQTQWRTIGAVSKLPGISQTALAEILDIQPISVGRLIDRMETAGWIERRPDPDDRRAVCLYITEKAMSPLKTLKATADEMMTAMTKGLSKEDVETAMRVLSAMRANLTEDGDQK